MYETEVYNIAYDILLSFLLFAAMWPKLTIFIGLVAVRLLIVSGNPDAKRLYDDLLSSYNKLVRPVVNTSDVLRVSIKLKLSQLIDVVSNDYIISTGTYLRGRHEVPCQFIIYRIYTIFVTDVIVLYLCIISTYYYFFFHFC